MNTSVAKKNPLVLLVGRTNVGKSTLFNRLAHKKRSIVLEREGVTRDYIKETISLDDKAFDLIDTGGFQLKKNINDIDKRIQEKVKSLLAHASVLLFVVDGKNGLTDHDLHIARELHKTKKPLVLLINKADSSKALEDHGYEFQQLGIHDIFPVSGLHGSGITKLLDHLYMLLPDTYGQDTTQEKAHYAITIIGKPNVGKSSLMNLLLEKERSIVSDVAGTTREAISDTKYHCEDLVQITDTAGVRKQSSVHDNLEQLMVKSSLQSIRESNIILLVVDASQGALTDQELKLMFYAFEMEKPMLLIFNKFDLLKDDDYARDRLNQSIAEYEFILKKIPSINTSCLDKRNVHKIFETVKKVIKRCSQPFEQLKLEEIIYTALKKKPLYHTEQQLKLSKIKHIKGSVPTFSLHVNYPEWFGPTELKCIENILRENYDLEGCPVAFNLKRDRCSTP